MTCRSYHILCTVYSEMYSCYCLQAEMKCTATNSLRYMPCLIINRLYVNGLITLCKKILVELLPIVENATHDTPRKE